MDGATLHSGSTQEVKVTYSCLFTTIEPSRMEGEGSGQCLGLSVSGGVFLPLLSLTCVGAGLGQYNWWGDDWRGLVFI